MKKYNKISLLLSMFLVLGFTSCDKDFEEIKKLADQIIQDEELTGKIETLVEEVIKTFVNEGKVLICGNGGSSTDAMHFAEEFTGRFRKERRALPVIALTDASHITCVANDYGFEEIFSRAVEAYGKKYDLLIAISTSGNSRNVINAVKKAQEMKIEHFVLSGKTGGILNEITDNIIIVPGEETDRIQELHGMIMHMVIELTERNLFPELYEEKI